jgi:glycosyltransferase involved in cell wall biosynthesis
VKQRWLGIWGWPLDLMVGKLTKVTYSLKIFLIETSAALHMLWRRRSVYHVLYGDTDFWLLGRVARWTRNAVVATFHEGAKVLEELAIDERLTRQLSGVILLSESQRPYFEHFLPPDRIFVVSHGVDTEFFTPATQPGHERICITVGGHTRDFATLARAIELVWEKDPNVRFVAISTHVDRKDAPLVCEGVEFRSGLTDEELLQAYQTASLAVFPFEWATANNSLLEAMACGLPIVATDVGGVPEYVGDEAAILCPPSDPHAMAEAMLQLLDDPAAAATMGAAARQNVIARDYRVVAEELGKVYTASLRNV